MIKITAMRNVGIKVIKKGLELKEMVCILTGYLLIIKDLSCTTKKSPKRKILSISYLSLSKNKSLQK